MARMVWLVLALGTCGLVQGQNVIPGLHPYATLGQSYDDNLFRLADDNPGYDGVRGDHSTQLQAGLAVDELYGRQRIKLQAMASRVTFRHFNQLDYNGEDLLADLGWRLGNHVDGTAGVHHVQVLAPYTDIATRERNLRTQRNEYATANWSFYPGWRTRLSLVRDNYSYDLASQAYNNRSAEARQIGIDYLASSGSTIGVQVGQNIDRYDNLRLFGGQQVDAGNKQSDVKLRIDWRATPVSSLQVLGGWARRRHAYFAERDSSGFNARLKGVTTIGGQVALDVAVWREFDAVESVFASYAMQTGASVNVGWTLSAKLQATAQSRYQRRAFSGLQVSNSAFDVSDRTRNTSLGLTYMPLPKVQMSAALYRETRGGLAALVFGNGNYQAQGVNLNVNLKF